MMAFTTDKFMKYNEFGHSNGAKWVDDNEPTNKYDSAT